MGASLYRYWDGSIRLSVPYNPPWLAAFKDAVPFKFREWDAAAKTWTVRSSHAREAERLARRYWPDLSVLENRPRRGGPSAGCPYESTSDHWSVPPPTPIRPEAEAYKALHLLPSAPPALIEAAYRTLSLTAHPDRGGSDAQQRGLNAAIATLRRQVAS